MVVEVKEEAILVCTAVIHSFPLMPLLLCLIKLSVYLCDIIPGSLCKIIDRHAKLVGLYVLAEDKLERLLTAEISIPQIEFYLGNLL